MNIGIASGSQSARFERENVFGWLWAAEVIALGIVHAEFRHPLKNDRGLDIFRNRPLAVTMYGLDQGFYEQTVILAAIQRPLAAGSANAGEPMDVKMCFIGLLPYGLANDRRAAVRRFVCGRAG